MTTAEHTRISNVLRRHIDPLKTLHRNKRVNLQDTPSLRDTILDIVLANAEPLASMWSRYTADTLDEYEVLYVAHPETNLEVYYTVEYAADGTPLYVTAMRDRARRDKACELMDLAYWQRRAIAEYGHPDHVRTVRDGIDPPKLSRTDILFGSRA